jgi:hypothetical protein
MNSDDEDRGPVIKVWASAVGPARGSTRAREMITSPPVVRRYNDWGYWNPLVLSVSPLAEFDFEERDVSAAVWYRQQSRCAGIEFVVISTHKDVAPFRTFSSGMLLVPVQDADWPVDAFPPPSYFLYDGWYPVEDDGPEAIRAALRRIEDTLDFFAYQHGTKLRWVVKYVEIFGADMTRGVRTTGEGDELSFRDRLSRLLDLPPALQGAVRRSAHWRQNYERQQRKTDRFLALWLALESLLLVLYDHCGPLGLVVVKEEAGLTKRERRALRDRHVEEVLARNASLPPSERIRTAYFEAVVPIRKQVESVLAAVFESNEQSLWLYGKTSTISPADLRSKLVHEGWSESEACNACRVDEYCRRLDILLRELIERILLRKWGGTCPLAFRGYERSMLAENGLAAPSAEHMGDFRITLGFLMRKGLIDVV